MRRYRDLDDVVHWSSDHGHRNRITLCERYFHGEDVFDTEALEETEMAPSCFRCIFWMAKLWLQH